MTKTFGMAVRLTLKKSSILYEAPGSKISHSAHPDQSDPESKNGPNGFGLDAVLFWASGTQ